MVIGLKATEITPSRYPEGLEGWKLVRIEYYDSHEYCVRIYLMWLPPRANLGDLEELFRSWQEE